MNRNNSMGSVIRGFVDDAFRDDQHSWLRSPPTILTNTALYTYIYIKNTYRQSQPVPCLPPEKRILESTHKHGIKPTNPLWRKPFLIFLSDNLPLSLSREKARLRLRGPLAESPIVNSYIIPTTLLSSFVANQVAKLDHNFKGIQVARTKPPLYENKPNLISYTAAHASPFTPTLSHLRSP